MAMEALRKFRETWKQWPQEILLLFLSICVMGLAVGLCASTMSRKKRQQDEGGLVREAGVDGRSSWGVIKRALAGSVRWSRRSGWWNERGGGVDLQKMPALLAGCREVEWSGISSPVSPLWQRRILMGERCELPKFSGVILYDERGCPLRNSDKASTPQVIASQKSKQRFQERSTAAVSTTTLRDLL